MTPQEERDKLLKDAIAKFEDRKERQLYIDGVLDMYNAIMSMFHCDPLGYDVDKVGISAFDGLTEQKPTQL